MIFEDFKNSLPSIKMNNPAKSKKDEQCNFDPYSILCENGLIGNDIIIQNHSSCVLTGFYHEHTPALIKIVNRTDNFSEERELSILKTLNGKKHIVQLYDCILKHQYGIFVFQKVDAIPGVNILTKSLSLENVRFLLRGVLEALSEAHKNDIIHRDVTFENILVSPNFDEVYLINWDTATKIKEHMSSTIGSRSIRSPEMLMGFDGYRNKADVWAFGVLILSIISDGRIPWKSDNPKETLIEMAAFFGAQNLLNLEKTLHKRFAVKSLRKHVNDMIIPLETSLSPNHANLDNKDLMDLLHKCFILDFRLRPSVSDLLNHEFFKS
ncbi:hypothetical protein M9Y10_015747 [Tritrichomonas musculus]|uniref:non-specific serine/threonine protein kinase n=1 Tax=Tritrichomonas musculus TaxID=1915356 RepID=A0ABR2I5U5_9EUKA